jgi:DNA-directed RNA polymerase subunit RPC12/RpoP
MDRKLLKPIGRDLRLTKALAATMGWNPITINRTNNQVANFRCQNCGTLQGIGTRDMQSEFEHKCPVCGLRMCFNRKPHKLDGRQQEANKRSMLGNKDVTPNPFRGMEELVDRLAQLDAANRKGRQFEVKKQ